MQALAECISEYELYSLGPVAAIEISRIFDADRQSGPLITGCMIMKTDVANEATCSNNPRKWLLFDEADRRLRLGPGVDLVRIENAAITFNDLSMRPK